MNKWIIAILVFLLLPAIGQQLNAQDYAKAADEHCKCFKPFDDSISKSTKHALIQATRGKSFRDSLVVEMGKMTTDEQKLLLTELEKFAKAMEMAGEGNGLISCMAGLEEKYGQIYMDDNNMVLLIKKLQEQHCEFLAAVMILAMEEMKKEDGR